MEGERKEEKEKKKERRRNRRGRAKRRYNKKRGKTAQTNFFGGTLRKLGSQKKQREGKEGDSEGGKPRNWREKSGEPDDRAQRK